MIDRYCNLVGWLIVDWETAGSTSVAQILKLDISETPEMLVSLQLLKGSEI